MCPGRNKKRHRRNLTTDIQTLKTKYNAQVIVTLVRPQELESMKLTNYFDEIKKQFTSYHFPIRDKWLPDTLGLCKCVEFILQELKQGKKIVVHCNGGKGRAATVCASVLIAMGACNAREAISIIKQCRSGSLKNPLQQIYLMQFAGKWNEYLRTKK